MITTYSDIQTQVLLRTGITTSTAFITDAILGGSIRSAIRWATAYKKWPFAEGRIETTFATASGPGGDEWYFEGYKADTFRFMQIGGKRLQKINFEDYQIFREERPGADDRVFSDFGKTVFINPNVDASGTLYAYGQYNPADIDITDASATTIFSNGNDEGNEAIVEAVIADLRSRQQKAGEVQFHKNNAIAILEKLWENISGEQFAYHTKDRGMWNRIDVLSGVENDELIKRDQF